jgi:hypothetical protein
MSKITFTEDPSSRKVTRFLFLLQMIGMGIVLVLSLRHLAFLAIAISIMTLIIFIMILLWLYARYREFPVVREKRELERLMSKFRKGVQTEEKNIQAAVKERARLFAAEEEEIGNALETLQRNHIEIGLRMASIQEAAISGIGPQLKERLVGQDICSAADISEQMRVLPGIAADEHQALMDWRCSVLDQLESTQPNELPPARLAAIQQRVRTRQEQNNADDRKARASKQMLEYEILSFNERLKQLAPFTFSRYLSRSLASRRIIAAPLSFALVLTQVVSSVSATASSIISWSPSVTTLATSTLAGVAPEETKNTITDPPTATMPAAEMIAALHASTFTLTPAPTETAASTQTQPLTPTATHTPFATFTVEPSDTAIIPVSGGGNAAGNCDPSYPGVCIPPAPPDLDCKDVPYRRFQVLPPDPHSFDRDGDGIGCES